MEDPRVLDRKPVSIVLKLAIWGALAGPALTFAVDMQFKCLAKGESALSWISGWIYYIGTWPVWRLCNLIGIMWPINGDPSSLESLALMALTNSVLLALMGCILGVLLRPTANYHR